MLLQVTNLANKSAPPVNDDIGHAAPAASRPPPGYKVPPPVDTCDRLGRHPRRRDFRERTISLPPPALIKSLSSLQDASSGRAASGLRARQMASEECGMSKSATGRMPPSRGQKRQAKLAKSACNKRKRVVTQRA
jgi:hypothetical protein